MKPRLLCLAVLVVAPLAAAIEGPVKVDGGLVSGLPARDASIIAFKGIPFAAPPVGDLRWRAPQPVIPWQGVRKAADFGTSCVQTLTPGKKGFGPWTWEFLTQNQVGEDCLTLNVWTPAKSPRAKLPVFVWIYGGGFNSGSSEVPLYDGEGLASKGLIVVTINYRVGILGFFAHPELTKESGHNASGNQGLLDQVAALQWVHRNIAAFGGDPARVTIAGQSAGAMSVMELLTSPLTNGLFHGAIVQSGVSCLMDAATAAHMQGETLASAEAAGVAFATKQGATSLKDLRALPWQTLLKASPADVHFVPIVDGYLEPSADGKLHDVATMAGCTTGEISTGVMGGGPPNPAAADQRLSALYQWARQRAATAKQPAYLYLWDHVLPGPDAARYGAFHSSELAYVLNTLHASDRPFTDADRKIAEMMSSYWANFVTTGNPNGAGVPKWPAVSDKREVMEVGDHTGPVPLK